MESISNNKNNNRYNRRSVEKDQKRLLLMSGICAQTNYIRIKSKQRFIKILYKLAKLYIKSRHFGRKKEQVIKCSL